MSREQGDGSQVFLEGARAGARKRNFKNRIPGARTLLQGAEAKSWVKGVGEKIGRISNTDYYIDVY